MAGGCGASWKGIAAEMGRPDPAGGRWQALQQPALERVLAHLKVLALVPVNTVARVARTRQSLRPLGRQRSVLLIRAELDAGGAGRQHLSGDMSPSKQAWW